MQLWAVMIVRNEADILAANVLHHLSKGVDRFLIVDNGSSDGTDVVLRQLGRDRRIRWTVDRGPYRQARITTELAREAYLGGADWVLPIDADEFWWSDDGDLRTALQGYSAGALRVDVINFVQRRSQHGSQADALLHMTRRPPRPVGPVEHAPDLVQAREIGFVEMMYPPKWVSRATVALEIEEGNHVVTGLDGPARAAPNIVCLHAPLRCRAVLDAKVEQGQRIAELQRDLRQRAWHVLRWKQLAEAGSLDAEWAANSYADGGLDVYGSHHPVVYDSRLADVVTPWLAAAAAMAQTPAPGFASLPGGTDGDAERALPGDTIAGGDLPQDLPLFDAMLERTREIEGWLRAEEARLLMATAWRVSTNATTPIVVEIGSYCGKSTVVLASALKAFARGGRLHAIDPHEGVVGAHDSAVGVSAGAPTLEALRRNLAHAEVADIVEIVPKRSSDVAWTAPIHLLFIDGLHDGASVRQDFAHFDSSVAAHGYVAFHDCDDSFPGVQDCIEEVLASGRYREVGRAVSLVVLQKLAEGERIAPGAPAVRTARLERGIRLLERVIQQRDQRIAERSGAIEWLQGVVARQKELSAEQEKGIAWLRSTLTERERTIGEQEKAIEWLLSTLADRQNTIAEQERALTWLQDRLARHEPPAAEVPVAATCRAGSSDPATATCRSSVPAAADVNPGVTHESP
jgi:predicted O-methyltransferase YrrM